MPTFQEVANLAFELHDKKVVNLDTPLRDLLKPQSLSGTVYTGILVWDNYFLVGGGSTASVQEFAELAKAGDDAAKK